MIHAFALLCSNIQLARFCFKGLGPNTRFFRLSFDAAFQGLNCYIESAETHHGSGDRLAGHRIDYGSADGAVGGRRGWRRPRCGARAAPADHPAPATALRLQGQHSDQGADTATEQHWLHSNEAPPQTDEMYVRRTLRMAG
jgi:hypothetical protein